MSAEEFGGLWDDIQEAMKWKPVVPLLKAAREAPDEKARLVALREVGAFIIRTLTGESPYSSRPFAMFCTFVELAQTDDRVLAMWESALPQKKLSR